jgi:hypothetical protein
MEGGKTKGLKGEPLLLENGADQSRSPSAPSPSGASEVRELSHWKMSFSTESSERGSSMVWRRGAQQTWEDTQPFGRGEAGE